jgi:hypothetical protein
MYVEETTSARYKISLRSMTSMTSLDLLGLEQAWRRGRGKREREKRIEA